MVNEQSVLDRVTTDAFASRALKIRFLFDCPTSSVVAGVGPVGVSLAHEFSALGFPLATSASALVDLAIVDVRGDWQADRQVAAAAARLAPSGLLLVLATRRWSMPRAIAAIRGHRLAATSLRPTMRALMRRGFHVREFISTGGPSGLDDFFDTRHPPRPPGDAPARVRVLARTRLAPVLFADQLMVASRQPDGLSTLVAAIEGAAGGTVLTLVRVAFRERGALIVVLDGKAPLVARVATDDAIATVLRRNAAFLARLHAIGGEVVRSRIPHPLATVLFRGRNLWLETRCTGDLAWLTARDRDRERMLRRDALDFIIALGQATERPVMFDAAALYSLVGRDLAALEGALGTSVSSDAVAGTRRHLGRLLEGRPGRVVAGHGDFGYGNILCDDAGRMTGVIDWDTHVETELLGVDWWNLVLQSRRSGADSSLTGAVRGLAADLAGHPGATEEWTVFRGAFAMTDRDIAAAFGAAVIRMIRRALPYTSEWERNRSDFQNALSLVPAALAAIP